jgi:two-component system, OmpR family, response regulator MprA
VKSVGTGWRLLLVDDDALIVELLVARLEAQGFTVATAENGEKAWDQLETLKPHLVVCDVVMPVVDGPTFCRRVRAAKNAVPFLFVTAKGQPRDIVEVLSAGADDYIVKPFDAGELLARIQTLLRRFYPTTPPAA